MDDMRKKSVNIAYYQESTQKQLTFATHQKTPSHTQKWHTDRNQQTKEVMNNNKGTRNKETQATGITQFANDFIFPSMQGMVLLMKAHQTQSSKYFCKFGKYC